MTNESVTMPDSSPASLLTWFESLGYGTLYHVPRIDYDADYFTHYLRMDKTAMGRALTNVRIELVERYWTDTVVDIGIGGGEFMTAWDWKYSAFGYDINPTAVEWLKSGQCWLDIDNPCETIQAATFWDSLEHMTLPEAADILSRVHEYAFVSMPIYRDKAHVLGSKHFKPGEHLVYFTHEGFITWMREQGFTLIERNDQETLLGREGIRSFAFKRTRWA